MPTTKRQDVIDAFEAVLAAIVGVNVYHGLDRFPTKSNAPGIVWMAGVPSPVAPDLEEVGEDGYDMRVELDCLVTASAVTGLDEAASELYGLVKAAVDAADATQFTGTLERCRDVTEENPVIVLNDQASELVAVFQMAFSLRFHTAERTPYV